MTSQHTANRVATPTVHPLPWITGFSAVTATVVLALGFWHLATGGMVEWLMVPGFTLIDGPLVQGPLISLGDLFRDIQIGQFQ